MPHMPQWYDKQSEKREYFERGVLNHGILGSAPNGPIFPKVVDPLPNHYSMSRLQHQTHADVTQHPIIKIIPMLRTVSNYKNVILRGPESPCNLKHVHWGSPFWGSKLLWRREHIWWPFWGVTTNELLKILKPTKLMGSTNKIGGITTENWDSWDKHDDPFVVVSLVRNAPSKTCVDRIGSIHLGVPHWDTWD
jgi:hypothetical protein